MEIKIFFIIYLYLAKKQQLLQPILTISFKTHKQMAPKKTQWEIESRRGAPNAIDTPPL